MLKGGWLKHSENHETVLRFRRYVSCSLLSAQHIIQHFFKKAILKMQKFQKLFMMPVKKIKNTGDVICTDVSTEVRKLFWAPN